MIITTRYTKIKNGIYYLKVDERELEIIEAGLIYFMWQPFVSSVERNRKEIARQMTKEIREVLG